MANSRFAAILQILLLASPWSLRRRLLRRIFGYNISASARIGLSLVLSERFVMDEHASIGHFTYVKGLTGLELGRFARIGNLNWISGNAGSEIDFFADETDRQCLLAIEEHAALTNRHYIDCTNVVRIGAFSTVAGVRSQILTHGIDIRQSKQTSASISIGRYCFVGSGVIVLKGASLPDYCVLGAGSILRTKEIAQYTLYSGVPAVAVRVLDGGSLYFHRTEGFIH